MHGIIYCYIFRWGTVAKKCYRRIVTNGGTSAVLLRVDTILLPGLSPWMREILFGPTVGKTKAH